MGALTSGDSLLVRSVEELVLKCRIWVILAVLVMVDLWVRLELGLGLVLVFGVGTRPIGVGLMTLCVSDP